MPSIAITGGIACGKSSVRRFLGEALQTTPYDADYEVAQLLKKDDDVIGAITDHWGKELLAPSGGIDHRALRHFLTEYPQERPTLEALLHPRLQKIWQPLAEEALHDPQKFFLAEIPLLFEQKLAHFFHSVIAVGASIEVQINRLIYGKKWQREEAIAFLSWQAPLEDKIKAATYLIWNDGTEETLTKQVLYLLPFLKD